MGERDGHEHWMDAVFDALNERGPGTGVGSQVHGKAPEPAAPRCGWCMDRKARYYSPTYGHLCGLCADEHDPDDDLPVGVA